MEGEGSSGVVCTLAENKGSQSVRGIRGLLCGSVRKSGGVRGRERNDWGVPWWGGEWLRRIKSESVKRCVWAMRHWARRGRGGWNRCRGGARGRRAGGGVPEALTDTAAGGSVYGGRFARPFFFN